MKSLGKKASVISMVLCFSFCMGVVSHAEAIRYIEIYKPQGASLDNYTSSHIMIDSSGRLVDNIFGYSYVYSKGKSLKRNQYARVTYDSYGNKRENVMIDYYNYSNNYSEDDKYVYGSRAYGINEKKECLVVYNKKGKVLKKIKFNISKYLRKKYLKQGYVHYRMAEVASKNKVRLFYYHRVKGKTIYGGIIEVNPGTGKVKKLISTNENEFVPQYYDGKYLYRHIISNGKVSFYRKSVKTKKTEKFTADEIAYDDKKYLYSEPMYSFYNGNILGIEPGGKVFYGEFDSKTFEQVGDISSCKYFKDYEPQILVMKSKKEFYIPYSPSLDKDEEPDGSTEYGEDFIVKYKN